MMYFRDYRKVYRAVEVRLAKRDGAESLRSAVIEHFMHYDKCNFTGRAVAAILRNVEIN